MLKFYQKKKTSQVPVGEQQKIRTASLATLAPRVELPKRFGIGF